MRPKISSKTYLKVLLAAGVIAVIGGGAGTFATFTAETTNANNSFATGTLLLQNKGFDSAGAALTTCNSESNTGNAITTGCSTFFNLSNLNSTGSWPQVAYLTLKNTGTLDSADISFKGSCSSTDVGTPVFGTAQLCDGLQLNIVELDNASTAGTPVTCVYPVGTATCTASTTLSATAFTTPTNLLLSTAGGTGNTGTELAAGGERYFEIVVNPAATFDNTYQNRKATFSLTWHLSA